jgi:hypothetical protein
VARSSVFLRPSALVLALFLAPPALGAQATLPGAGKLSIRAEDLRIEQRGDAGYHLYIRASSGLGSVLLTESTTDPARKADSYAYRAVQKNAINGDEPRVLDGKRMSPTNGQYFLVDSSPEPDAQLGSAFHVFIPWVVVWGYSWSRSGREFIHDGSFVNIRAFSKPFADYSGAYADNPYVVRVSQAPSPTRAVMAAGAPPAPATPLAAPTPAPPAPAAAPAPVATPAPVAAPVPTPVAAPAKSELAARPAPAAPAPATVPPPAAAPVAAPAKTGLAARPAPASVPATAAPAAIPVSAARTPTPPKGHFMPETVEAFSSLVGANGGKLAYAAAGGDVPEAIDGLLAADAGADVDIVLCVDTTDTMADTIEAIKTRLPGLLAKRVGGFSSYRLGLVAYKDYFEEYLYRRFDFTSDLATFSGSLEALRSGGGRDVPEAVYEALYASLNEFSWSAAKRIVILVGDAPPHPLPRGSVDGAMVDEAAAAVRVELDAVIGPA